MNEKVIFNKLLKIAENQQKMLQKLSQHTYSPEQVKQAIEKAAKEIAQQLNLHPTEIVVGISGGDSYISLDGDKPRLTSINANVSFSGIPQNEEVRQKLIDTLNKQVKTDFPQVNSFAIFFKD